MRWLVTAVAIGSLAACSGGSNPASPTPASNANVAGSYNATITASSTCSASLPSATRVLTYIADVAQTGASVQVTLLAHVIWNSVTVAGTVSGQTINFSSFSFSEITTGGGVGLAGTGSVTVASDGSMAGTLNGTLQSASGASCNATNHQLQLVKR